MPNGTTTASTGGPLLNSSRAIVPAPSEIAGSRPSSTNQAPWRSAKARAGAFDQATDPVDVDALLDFCRERMATYMVPGKIHVVAGEMPRNANGKLDRPAIIAACGGK